VKGGVGTPLAAVALLGLVVAQDLAPARDWYHGWQYITLLALGIAVVAAAALRAWRGGLRRRALALAGALLAGCAGFIAALIGPDTIVVTGAPGTVTPVGEIGAAAAFPPATPATLAAGGARVELRRRGAAPLEIGARPVPLGLAVAFARPHLAAYVTAEDAAGRRLTVTQPVSPAFLSPVLFFRQVQTIRDRAVPFDEFAVPALHRVVHALAFSPADMAAFGRTLPGGAGGVVLSVEDDRGTAQGLGIALSGTPVTVGGLRVTITTGTYPDLVVASAPQPQLLVGGIALFLVAGAWSLIGKPAPAVAA
jgi:hypothetical protein